MDESQSLGNSIGGVVFLGTPHREDTSLSYAEILSNFGQVVGDPFVADGLTVNSRLPRRL